MRCRWFVALWLVGACGRFGFDARTTGDGGGGDGRDGPRGDGSGALTASYLKASNTDMYDQFGIAVALSGDGSTLAVGAYDESSGATGVDGNQADNSITHAGAVYVFVRAGATWVQQAYVKASNTDVNDQFGHSLAISYDGSTLAVGAYLEDSAATGVDGNQADNTATDAGAAYVFARAGTTWAQQAYIKATNTHPGDQLGYAVALSGDGNTLAVGAPLEDTGGTDSGAAYVYTRTGTTWSAQTMLFKASDAAAGDQLGSSLALTYDGTTLAIAAPSKVGGAVYVFVPSGLPGVWTQQASLVGSTSIGGDFFGEGLAIDTDTLAIGSPGDDTNASNGGALYVFSRAGTAWSQQAKLYAPDAASNDQFATAVALAGNRMIAGAASQSAGTGEAYVFAGSGASWDAGTIVQAMNPGVGDGFGVSVSLAASGSYAVGAFREDSSTTGVDSTPDDAAMDAGAAYVWAY